MESINFNDFSLKERHEIIKAFLIKMRKANSMQSAQRFFEYYLKQFYKIPTKLLDDIVYCQRTMKTYLSVHQTISETFEEKASAATQSAKIYLLQIEDVLYEINAECQYLVIWLEDDIDRFCLPFTEQQMLPNGNLINEMVSEAVAPRICASVLPLKPHFVVERATENQLLRKFLHVSTQAKATLDKNKDENLKPTNAAAPKKQTTLDNNKDESLKPTNAVAPKKKTAVNAATSATQGANNKQAAKPAAAPQSENNSKTDVNASRLNLQEALKRARLNQMAKCDAKGDSPKEQFLQLFGLCTHLEHKRKILAQTLSQKRKPKPKLVQK